MRNERRKLSRETRWGFLCYAAHSLVYITAEQLGAQASWLACLLRGGLLSMSIALFAVGFMDSAARRRLSERKRAFFGQRREDNGEF